MVLVNMDGETRRRERKERKRERVNVEERHRGISRDREIERSK